MRKIIPFALSIHYRPGIQYDFGHDTFYGQPIDNNEVVKGYIQYQMIIK